MTRLDYSVPEFQIFVGTFDCTDYLDTLSISVPKHELIQPLIWTGQFSLSYNRKAVANGLSEAEFSHLLTPSRWRSGQQQVKLIINGYPLPMLRIERYAYNAQTQRAEGTLTQVLALVSGTRVGVTLTTVLEVLFATSSRFIGRNLRIYSYWAVTLKTLVENFLKQAFVGATITTPAIEIAGIGGLNFAKITTRDPVADAQKLCGINFRWLTVDTIERIVTVDGVPGASIFSRSIGQVDWEPDLQNISFAASKVYVTGTYQSPSPVTSDSTTTEDIDSKGRLKSQTIEETVLAGKIFPSLKGVAGQYALVGEIKTVYYQYSDATGTPTALGNGLTTDIALLIPWAAQFVNPVNLIDPYQTITVVQQPAGRIYSSFGVNSTMRVASIEIQNDYKRSKYEPKGIVTSGFDKDFTLVLSSQETLKEAPFNYYADRENLEQSPYAEPRQPSADASLANQSVLGKAIVAPAGWTPIYAAPYVVDVGFLPPSLATALATKLAAREQYRRDAVQITIPIPSEWLAAGCPLLACCQVYDGLFQMDGIILSLVEGMAKFSFSGSRVATYSIVAGVATGNPIPVFDPISEVDLGFVVEIEVTAEIVPPPIVVAVDLAFVAEIVVTSQTVVPSVSSSVAIEFVPEVLVTTGFPIVNAIAIEFTPEIVITSTVAAAAGTIAIEGYDGSVVAIEGNDGNTITIEGRV
jgi:hypothetical protein